MWIYIKEVPDSTGPEALTGKHLHQIFFDYYKTLDIKKISDEYLIRHAMDYDNGALSDHLQNFAAFNCYIYSSLKDKAKIKPVLIEEHLFYPKLNMSGYVDAIFEDDDNNCMVLDYKTGKFDEKRLHEYRQELSIYSELAKESKRCKPTHWGISFTKSGVFWKENIQPDYFKTSVLPLFKELRESIAKQLFPPNVGPLCLYCSMKNRCSAWSRSSGAVLKM